MTGDLGPGTAALIGALIGGAASIGGTLLSRYLERESDLRRLRIEKAELILQLLANGSQEWFSESMAQMWDMKPISSADEPHRVAALTRLHFPRIAHLSSEIITQCLDYASLLNTISMRRLAKEIQSTEIPALTGPVHRRVLFAIDALERALPREVARLNGESAEPWWVFWFGRIR